MGLLIASDLLDRSQCEHTQSRISVQARPFDLFLDSSVILNAGVRVPDQGLTTGTLKINRGKGCTLGFRVGPRY